MESGSRFPAIPEFTQISEIVVTAMLQAVSGEKEVKTSMDDAATQVVALLTERGYYK